MLKNRYFVLLLLVLAVPGIQAEEVTVRVERLLDAPIITTHTHPSIGENIQGPSLIRVPDWIESPLGAYYLYFADHKGSYIRLAFADRLEGPWSVHPRGSLQIADSHFPSEPPEAPTEALARIQAQMDKTPGGLNKLPHDLLQELTAPHIASPDVHVDSEARSIVMYFHGLEGFANQVTRVAVSSDGISFRARPEILGKTYMRAFQHRGIRYAMAMPGQFYRTTDGLSNFAVGPRLFNSNMRHAALLVRGDTLYVFWTQVGDVPERILLSTIDLSADWFGWEQSEPMEVLRPEETWEGADAPLVASLRSVAYGQVNQLRDPAIFEEGSRTYLLYAVAGESGIAIAEVFFGE